MLQSFYWWGESALCLYTWGKMGKQLKTNKQNKKRGKCCSWEGCLKCLHLALSFSLKSMAKSCQMIAFSQVYNSFPPGNFVPVFSDSLYNLSEICGQTYLKDCNLSDSADVKLETPASPTCRSAILWVNTRRS